MIPFLSNKLSLVLGLLFCINQKNTLHLLYKIFIIIYLETFHTRIFTGYNRYATVCPGSSEQPEKTF